MKLLDPIDKWSTHVSDSQHAQRKREQDRQYMSTVTSASKWVCQKQRDNVFAAHIANLMKVHPDTTEIRPDEWKQVIHMLYLCSTHNTRDIYTQYPASCFTFAQSQGVASMKWLQPLLHTLACSFQDPVEKTKMVTNKFGYTMEQPVPVCIPIVLLQIVYILSIWCKQYIYPNVYNSAETVDGGLVCNYISTMNDQCVLCDRKVPFGQVHENTHIHDTLAKYMYSVYCNGQQQVQCANRSVVENHSVPQQGSIHVAILYASVYVLFKLLHRFMEENMLEFGQGQSPIRTVVVERVDKRSGKNILYFKGDSSGLMPNTSVFVSTTGRESLDKVYVTNKEAQKLGIGCDICENSRLLYTSRIAERQELYEGKTDLACMLLEFLFPKTVLLGTDVLKGVYEGTINPPQLYLHQRKECNIQMKNNVLCDVKAGDTFYFRTGTCWTTFERTLTSIEKIYNALPWAVDHEMFPNGTAVFLTDVELAEQRDQPVSKSLDLYEKLANNIIDSDILSIQALHNDSTNPDRSIDEDIYISLITERVCSIIGPPGTGKSTSLVKIVNYQCNKGEHVFIVSQSNAAVDAQSEKLLSIEHVRYTAGITSKEIEQHRVVLGTCSGIGSIPIQSQYKEEASRAAKNVMVDDTARNANIMHSVTYVIIDEAGQCTNSSLLPVLALAPYARIVLAGDPFQLPPFTRLNTTPSTLLATRLPQSIWLPIQYRMHWILGMVVSDTTYQGRTKSIKLDYYVALHLRQLLECIRHDIDEADLSKYLYLYPGCKSSKLLRQKLQTLLYQAYASDTHLPYSYIPSNEGHTTKSVQLGPTLQHTRYKREHIEINDLTVSYDKHPVLPYDMKEFSVVTASPLTVIDVKGIEAKEQRSFYNSGEIECVCDTVAFIRKRYPTVSIAVLALYKPQVTKQMERQGETVAVSTIDGFQGQEADIIIISTVRSNAHGNLGFTDNSNRCNVAISRAKNNLIVVCNVDTYSKVSNPWSILLQTAYKLQCVHTLEAQTTFYNTQEQ